MSERSSPPQHCNSATPDQAANSPGSGSSFNISGIGSPRTTRAGRSVLMVGFDPNDADKRVVAHGKSNLAAPGPSRAYTLKSGRFAWAGRSSLSAEDLGGPPPDADQRSAREEAREFLLQTLADGPRSQVEQAEAAKIHISIASLRRAKGDLGVKASKISDHWGMEPPFATRRRRVQREPRCAAPGG
jgi:hypothetical protein